MAAENPPRDCIPLTIAHGEVCCRICGQLGNTSQALDPEDRANAACPHCHQRAWVLAVNVLRPGEYIITRGDGFDA